MAEVGLPDRVDTPALPDIMNDPHFEVNNGGTDDGTSDLDTCRICRGEGTEGEPLFHPCKCNGSIKHVHQACLMEWLSHSQKKHCELCKTPFRFTKLYAPNMPPTLPTGVFMRRLVFHSLQKIVTWLRFCLVSAVWLVCLPWGIRQVWWFLFWFSDGGWPVRFKALEPSQTSTYSQAGAILNRLAPMILAPNGTCPVTPLNAVQTTPASVGGLMEKFVGLGPAISQILNLSAADPLAEGVLRAISHGFGLQGATDTQSLSSEENTSPVFGPWPTSNAPTASKGQSLLSDVSWLKNLTSSPIFNRLVITVAEGYIITVLVVVSFILIFLIREWVVQQQPNLNMGAGLNAENAAPERALQVAENPPPLNPVDNLGAEDNVPTVAINADADAHHPEALPNLQHDARAGRGRRNAEGHHDRPLNELFDGEVYGGPARPTAGRDALTPAAEIQKQLTEEPRMTEEFMAIWRRAESDPNEVLRIIERENKQDEMRYWVNAMKNLHGHATLKEQSLDPQLAVLPTASSSIQSAHVDSRERPAVDSQTGSEQDSASSDSWIDVPKQLSVRDTNASPHRAIPADTGEYLNDLSQGKGKGKAVEEYVGASLKTDSQSSPSANSPQHIPISGVRPRAVSDGPPPKDTISSLANNNWSFKDIPEHDQSIIPLSQNNENRGSSITDTSDPRQLIPDEQPDSINQNQGVELDGQQDRPWRTSEEWADIFEREPRNNLVDTDDEVESGHSGTHTPEENPFAPDTALPPLREPIVAAPVEPQGIVGAVADWLWGGIEDDQGEDLGVNDEHIVEDLAAEAPFVRVAHLEIPDPAQDVAPQDREVAEAALAAGIDPNDPDAIDDAEDFDGIMELIGMRGPILNLLQNALFSAFLLALTVAFGIWIPYQIGRISLLLTAHPGAALKLPLRIIFWFAAFIQDFVVSVIGVVSYCIIKLATLVLNYMFSTALGTRWASGSLRLSREAIDRILEMTVSNFFNFSDSDVFTFSAASHESLLTLKCLVLETIEGIGQHVRNTFAGDFTLNIANVSTALCNTIHVACQYILGSLGLFMKPDSWVISLEYAKRSTPLNLELSVWGTMDRAWATLAGYTTLSLAGALYVKRGSPFANNQAGREWEATIIDLLNQAGGVMKVILIISIEMLVFPLYCGLLLDVALLPLFEGATMKSRLMFTMNSPCTSIFVHWFVGTCYMFHFALFVSMCRKIMRKGVLYFIRDPDDPTFHPVRDVLERNVATQLRKILFSALVYGALVIICLGGVVWGLALAFRGVLPIHWSSNEPVLEFPIDLLFYNFLMPLAVRFFKPSDGLHSMYTWWFRQCARMLRLTWFMFDERQRDEEGHIVRRSWKDIWRGYHGETPPTLSSLKNERGPGNQFEHDSELKAYLLEDGRYVRAPASDQVRVKKGCPIFLDVDESNNRLEGQPDRPDGESDWDSDMYKQVYIPPHFKLRIFAFVVSIWIFAALTGVCITIVPLVFGRSIFSMLIPNHVRKNDVYAFSIGIYILGSALYMILNARIFATYLTESITLTADTPRNALRHASNILSRAARIIWVYSAVLFILPTLCAFLTEFYAIIPLHTYFFSNEPHTIHFVQSWTLGLLYIKLITRMVQFYPESRPAISLRLIIRDGYLNPDARLATRSFILPAALILSSAIVGPWLFARIAVLTVLRNLGEQDIVQVYRYVYPASLCAAWMLYMVYLFGLAVRGWRMRIRDEVYLIGERLHNFGERKATLGSPPVGLRRIET